MKNFQSLQRAVEAGDSINSRAFCEIMFPTVSRTFAINVGKLPTRLSFQVLISYMLCRIADTVEDDPHLPPQQKKDLLVQFSKLLDNDNWREDLQAFTSACQQLENSPADVMITQQAQYVFECFYEFSPEIRSHIAHWVSELALGMGQYAMRKKKNEKITFLTSIDDLEKYCYYVAGTVGHLLTGLFSSHYSCIDEELYQALEQKSSSFGLGLQLTNIIKDSIVDSERGWCYLPEDLLRETGLTRESFLAQDNRQTSQRLMYQIILLARKHLDNALAYSCMLPKRAAKVRIFCFLPLFMAIKTLSKAAFNEQLFATDNPVKISRDEVREIVRYTYLNWWSNGRMKKWYHQVSAVLDDNDMSHCA